MHHAHRHVVQAALVRMVCLGSRASEFLGRGSGGQRAIERVAIVETAQKWGGRSTELIKFERWVDFWQRLVFLDET